MTPRHPPAYSVAAQMARLHRLGRAHSHEGSVVGGGSGLTIMAKGGSSMQHFHELHCNDEDVDEDDGKSNGIYILLISVMYLTLTLVFYLDDDAQVSAV